MSTPAGGEQPPREKLRKPKREALRACDACRRRKVRCDGPSQPRHICTTCKKGHVDCTYNEHVARPEPRKAYIQALEARLRKAEALVKQLCPEIDLTRDLDNLEINNGTDTTFTDATVDPLPKNSLTRDAIDAVAILSDRTRDRDTKTPHRHPLVINPGVEMPTPARPIDETSFSPINDPPEHELVPSDDENVLVRLTDAEVVPAPISLIIGARPHPNFQTVMKTAHTSPFSTPASMCAPPNMRDQAAKLMRTTFLGKSSAVGLVQDAMELKFGESGWIHFQQHSSMWRRPEFWEIPKHEFRNEHMLTKPGPEAHLPPPDLLEKLIDAYFEDYNIYVPLLHKQLFLRQIASGRHESDAQFLAVVLLVCAIGSRSIAQTEPRVLAVPGEIKSAGWLYFEMVEPMNRVQLSRNARLFDLQMKVLTTFFLWGSSVPSSGWTTLGLAIRMAQEVGAHRRKVYRSKPNLVDELWKRAFWVITALDRGMSATFGRPSAMQDESFDVDLPLEVDDDCWDVSSPTAAQNFYPLMHAQPEGKPSEMEYFVCLTKLRQIQAFAMRTIYSINQSKVLLGYVGQRWERRIVAEIDTSIARWAATVPDHLRWDPARADICWFRQSSALWSAYYHLQLFVHRQFIRLPHPTKPISAENSDPISRSSSPPASTTAAPSDPTPKSTSSRSSRSSLNICTNAAFAVLDIVATHRRRFPTKHDMVLSFQASTSLFAGLILLLAAWGERVEQSRDRKTTQHTPPDNESVGRIASYMAGVRQTMELIKFAEKYWQAAGKASDMMNELVQPAAERTGLDSDDTDLDKIDICGSSFNFDKTNPLLRSIFSGGQPSNPQAASTSVPPSTSSQVPLGPDGVSWHPMFGTAFDAPQGLDWLPFETVVGADSPASSDQFTTPLHSTFLPLSFGSDMHMQDAHMHADFGSPNMDPLAWLGLNAYRPGQTIEGHFAASPSYGVEKGEDDWAMH